MKRLLFIFSIFLIHSLAAQKHIKDANGNLLAYIKDNIVLDSNHQVLYNYKGFILFEKTSNNKNDITLTFDIRKKRVKIFKGIDTTPNWIIRNGFLSWKNKQEEIEIISIIKKDGFTSFYNIENDSLIAFVDTENISDLEISISFFQLWETLNLEKYFQKLKVETSLQSENLPEGIIGAMKPVFGDEKNVWYWDGKYFFPALDNSQRYIWTYDGENLKALYNSNTKNEWSWDGEELSPFWGGHPRNNWRWENGILRQVFETNYKNEYEIVGNVIRKRFGSLGENEWEIEGKMPLPVLSLVLLGIVYR